VETTPASPVSQVTFYGIVESEPMRNFEISFFQDNAGTPGAMIASYTSIIDGVNTGELFGGYLPIYTYTYYLPTSVSLTAGNWLSVMAMDGFSSWYWVIATGGDGCIIQTPHGTACDYGDVAFCLGVGEKVPVSPWAMGIALALIGSAVIFRYRRIV
jgi:hypothetical protein